MLHRRLLRGSASQAHPTSPPSTTQSSTTGELQRLKAAWPIPSPRWHLQHMARASLPSAPTRCTCNPRSPRPAATRTRA
eukprot:8271959-Alexandrium_andersonii.AAC.1